VNVSNVAVNTLFSQMRDTVIAELGTDPNKDALVSAISEMERSVGHNPSRSATRVH